MGISFHLDVVNAVRNSIPFQELPVASAEKINGREEGRKEGRRKDAIIPSGDAVCDCDCHTLIRNAR